MSINYNQQHMTPGELGDGDDKGTILIESEVAMETENIDNELCLTCLAKNPTESLTKKIYESYKYLTFLVWNEDVPNKLCSSCYKFLQEISNFRSKCIASYNWFMKERQKQLTQRKKVSYHKEKKYVFNPTEDDIVLIVSDSVEINGKSTDTKNNKVFEHNTQTSNVFLNPKTVNSHVKQNKSESHDDDDDDYDDDDDDDDYEDDDDDDDDYDVHSIENSSEEDISKGTDINYSNAIIKLETVAKDAAKVDINTDTLENNDDNIGLPDEIEVTKINAEYVQKETNVTKKTNKNKGTIIKKKRDTKSKTNKNKVSSANERETKSLVTKQRIRKNGEVYENNYTIRYLNHEEQIEEFKKKMDSDNYKNSKFKCENCFRGFMSEESYKNHMYTHTDKFGSVICDICGIHTKSRNSLSMHKTNVHKKIMTCKSCPFTTSSSTRAKLHTNWHNGVKYKCEFCQKLFRRMSAVMSHKRIHHASEHVCALCGYTFLGEMGLKRHLILKHVDQEVPVDGPKCDECNLTFANEKVLATHMATSKKHGGTKTNNLLYGNRNHKKTIAAKKTTVSKQDGPKTCEQCNAVLPTDRKYRIHFYKYHSGSTITKGSFLCFICGKSFDGKTQLDNHTMSHDVGKTYKCDLCDLTFSTPRKYYSHHHIKHRKKKDQRKYSCTLCSKEFSSDSNRQRHETTFHSDVRNERCNYCEKAFKTKTEKKSHIDHVHFKKPWKKKNTSNKKMKKVESSGENNS